MGKAFWNEGIHFHLFCPDYDEDSKSGKHEYKLCGSELPVDLYRVVNSHEKPPKKDVKSKSLQPGGF